MSVCLGVEVAGSVTGMSMISRKAAIIVNGILVWHFYLALAVSKFTFLPVLPVLPA